MAIPRTSRRAGSLVTVVLLIAMIAPAGATSDGEQARDERDALAADLDALTASEAELQAAVDALAADVEAQTAAVAAARQAAAVAESEVVQARADLVAKRLEIEALAAQLVAKAVDSFIHAPSSTVLDVIASGDLSEAARRQSFVDQIVGDEDVILDQLRAAEEDLALQQEAAQAAQERAELRRTETERRLADLAEAHEEQAAALAALNARRQEVLAEIEALEAAEAGLRSSIEQGEQGTTSAERAPSSSGATNGGGCIWATSGTVTSEYGARWGRLHAGIDIAAPTGTPIYAARAGTVLVAGRQGGYGIAVVIDHGGGMTTRYAHQSRLVTRQGRSVAQGELIGYVGSTGKSTGPHLHLETRYGGEPRNPRNCLP